MDPLPRPPPPLAQRLAASLPSLARYVRGKLGAELASKESVSDIVQSTCGDILRRAAAVDDLGEAGFQAWLQRAAERKILSRARYWRAQCRDAAREPQRGGAGVEAPAVHDEPSRDAELREEVERLARALDGLSTEYRLVLQRSQFEGVPYAEIGRELERSPDAVRKLVARALARLAERLSAPPSR